MADHGLKMQLELVSSLVPTGKLSTDYLAGSRGLRPFFGGHYRDHGRLKEIAAAVDNTLDRRRAARIIEAQDTFAESRNGAERLRSFVDRGGFIVSTGQQPVLFGGPLYILYKAITLIKIARYAQDKLEVPVLPVFWNASEDHDFEEISSIHLPGQGSELESLSFPATGPAGGQGEGEGALHGYRPACMVEVSKQAASGLLSSLEDLLPESESRSWLLEMLTRSYSPGSDMGRAFSHYLMSLLGDLGIFIIDACSPALRRECRELFETEIFDSESSVEAVVSASCVLERSGYLLQVPPLPGDTSLFLVRGGVREKLQLAGRQEDNGGKGKKKFRLKRSGKTLSEGQIRGMLEESLSMFSPGVLLRPLVESSMLGTLCYVAGPGEIAYYAQMGELYHLRGLRMPIIYPRLGGILIEPGINRILDKLGIGAESLEAGAEALAGQLLAQAKNSSLAPALEELEQLRSIAGQRLAGIAKRVKKIDPSLDGPLSRTERSISGNIDRLAAKITAAAGRGDKTLLSRLNRAALNLWPGGMPQERRFASVYFLAQYGRHLLDFLLDQVRPELDG